MAGSDIKLPLTVAVTVALIWYPTTRVDGDQNPLGEATASLIQMHEHQTYQHETTMAEGYHGV